MDVKNKLNLWLTASKEALPVNQTSEIDWRMKIRRGNLISIMLSRVYLLWHFLIRSITSRSSSQRPFINYVRVLREGGLEKSLHALWGGGSNPFLRNIIQVDILYYKSRGLQVWQGSYFICVWKVKKYQDEIFFTCFDLRQTGRFSVMCN